MIELLLNPQTWLNWFAPVLLLAAAKFLYKKTTERLRFVFRHLQKKALIKIKNTRRNSFLIQWEINKTNTYFTLFLCSGVLFYIALFTTNLLSMIKHGFFSMLIAMTPILAFEFVWLNQENITKKIIISAQKIGRR